MYYIKLILVLKTDLYDFYKLPNFIYEIDNNNVYFSIWFFRKDDKYYLKLEIRVMCREFLALKYVFIFFSKQIRWLFIFVHRKSWKLALKTGFSINNIHLYLCWQEENTKWILSCRKLVWNVRKSFRVYKINYISDLYNL